MNEWWFETTNQPTLIMTTMKTEWKQQNQKENKKKKWMETREMREILGVVWNINRMKWTWRKWDRNTQNPPGKTENGTKCDGKQMKIPGW